MQPFLAIVLDTWRQSKQQWVFIILLVMLGAVTATFCAGNRVYEYPDNAEAKYSKTLIWRWQDEPGQFTLEDGWNAIYADMIRRQQGRDDKLAEAEEEIRDLQDNVTALRDEYNAAERRKASKEELDKITGRAKVAIEEYERKIEAKDKLRRHLQEELNAEVKRRSADISDLQKAIEVTMMTITMFLTWLAMLGFISAAAGYFPGLIAQGAVDCVLSRPVSRLQVFFGKYIGGLVLISLALLACWLVVFVSFGTITGIWHWRFFSALPMTLLSIALIYSIVAWVGLMTRSTALAMVAGLFFYMVVDTAIGFMVTQVPIDPLFSEWKWLVDVAKFIKWTFPNFTLMRVSAQASVCNIPIFEWQPMLVALTWLGLLLTTAYLRFRRTDF